MGRSTEADEKVDQVIMTTIGRFIIMDINVVRPRDQAIVRTTLSGTILHNNSIGLFIKEAK